MKKILLLTDFYSPNPSANGICIQKIAENLVKKGNKIFVIAYGTGGDAKHELINGVELYRVRAPYFYQVREKSKGKGISNFIFQLFRVIRKIQIALFLPLYPMSFPIFAMKYKKMACKVIIKSDIDEMIAEYVPIEALYTVINIKKRFPQIKTHAYIVDTFTQCPNALNHKIIYYLSRKWEVNTIKKCDDYFFLENFRQYYKNDIFENYREKIKAIGLPLIQNNMVPLRKRNEEIKLLYTGSWGGERDPQKIFFLLEKMNESDKIRFVYCGKENSTSTLLKKKYNFFDDKGYIKNDELIKVYRDVDFLISIGNSTNMIPSKIFSYISTGLPILHFYLSNEDPCLEILSKYPNCSLINLATVNEKILNNAINKNIDKRVSYEQIVEIYSNYEVNCITDTLIK